MYLIRKDYAGSRIKNLELYWSETRLLFNKYVFTSIEIHN